MLRVPQRTGTTFVLYIAASVGVKALILGPSLMINLQPAKAFKASPMENVGVLWFHGHT